MTRCSLPPSLDFPEDLRHLRVVLCHDWLTGMRGGERVLSVLCDLFPDAPIFTLIHNRAAIAPEINRHPITTSFLQKIPGIHSHYRNWLPVFPFAINRFHPPACDLIISTSHCVAKAIRPPPGARHLCYCFTPMRYAWTFHEEYFGRNPLKRMALTPLLALLRVWDRRTARRVTHFTAISRNIQDRIQRFYGRPADVVFPPVETDRWTPPAQSARGGFDLIVSALVPYKRIDLAIDAYNRLQRPLKIVGVGGEFDRLSRMAGPTIELLGWQTDDIILDLYRRCDALVFPGEEDFGIVPLEAQACGKPVIAYACGGALETITEGISGVFFAEQSVASLMEAVKNCHARSWDPAAIRQHAERFGRSAFLQGLAQSIRTCLATPNNDV
jgi:glycosyltransferase involved in cell wall biosynthesis